MASKFDNAEARLERASAYALYLHVPFCAQKCAYCDLASWATRRDDPLMSAYTDALVSQVRELGDIGALEGLRTAYIGGGTPSLLGRLRSGALWRARPPLDLRSSAARRTPTRWETTSSMRFFPTGRLGFP